MHITRNKYFVVKLNYNKETFQATSFFTCTLHVFYTRPKRANPVIIARQVSISGVFCCFGIKLFFVEKNENLSIIKLLLKMNYSMKNKSKTEKTHVNFTFDLEHRNHKNVFS